MRLSLSCIVPLRGRIKVTSGLSFLLMLLLVCCKCKSSSHKVFFLCFAGLIVSALVMRSCSLIASVA